MHSLEIIKRMNREAQEEFNSQRTAEKVLDTPLKASMVSDTELQRLRKSERILLEIVDAVKEVLDATRD